MKPILLKFLIPALLVLGISFGATAQKAQFIHNSPDPNLSSIDIYLIPPFGGATLLYPNLDFRQTSNYIDASLLNGLSVKIGIAPANSTGVQDTVLTQKVTFTSGNNYVFTLQGVVNTADFSSNPNGRPTNLMLLQKSNARTTSATTGNFDFFFVNGVADDSSRIIALRTNSGWFAFSNNFTYGDTTTYFSLPIGSYVFDVINQNTGKVESTHILTLPGGLSSVGVVVYSGFMDTVKNANTKSANWYLQVPSGPLMLGTTYQLQEQKNASIQLIHNSADPSIDTVDVYVNGIKAIDNLGFRAATGILQVPAGKQFTLSFAPKNSASATDAFLNTNIPSLLALSSYAVITKGVIDPSKFQVNPNGANIAFGLSLISTQVNAGANNITAVKTFHGITDLGYVDVKLRDSATVYNNGPYGGATNGYIQIPSKMSTFDVTDTTGKTKQFAFRFDLSNVKDSTIIMLLSGFVNPANNQNGAPAKLIAVLPNGKVIVSTDITGMVNNLLDNGIKVFAYPNPTTNFTNVAYKLDKSSSVQIRIVDQIGREIIVENKGNRSAGSYSDRMDLSNLGKGLYLIEVTANGQISQQWISKQ